MRTLKKSLALVLALVMVLGLGVIGASADNALDNYTDASEIGDAYYEAVGVLTGLGIIDGMTETTIEPTGTYTREQAAKIIATMVLGVKNAESLTCVEAPFDDVPADRWSAGYIAFCVEQGIIDGMTDTTFEPTGTLTGFQWAKMLLAAVGFGANGEFTGTSWSLNTARVAHEAGLFTGDLSGADHVNLSRQQAALYAFNTLTAIRQVTYSSMDNNYVYGMQFYEYADGTGFTLGKDVFDLSWVEGIVSSNEGLGSKTTILAAITVPAADAVKSETAASIKADTGLDVFRHAVRQWYTGDNYYNGKAVGVFTMDLAEVTEFDCNAIGGDDYKDLLEEYKDDGYSISGKHEVGNGTEYEVYVIDNSAYEHDDIKDEINLVSLKYAYTSMGVRSDNLGDKDYTTITGYGKVLNTKILTDISDIDRNDKIVVLQAKGYNVDLDDAVYYVYATGATSGNVVDYKSNGTIELSDGTVLTPSNLSIVTNVEINNLIAELRLPGHTAPAYSFVLDTHGHYIAMSNSEFLTVAYYTDAWKIPEESLGAWSSNVKYFAQFVDVATGDEEVVPVTADWEAWAKEGGYYDITDELYGDATYEPVPVFRRSATDLDYLDGKTHGDYAYVASETFEAKTSKVGDYRFDYTSVEFIIVSDNGDDLDIDHYIGNEALIDAYKEKYDDGVSKVTLSDIAVLTVPGVGTNERYVTVIFAYDGADTVAGGIAFFPKDVTSWGVHDNSFYNVMAYLNGEEVASEIDVYWKDTSIDAGFYNYTIDDTTGRYNLQAIEPGTSGIVLGTNAVGNAGTLYWLNGDDGKEYNLASDTPVIDLRSKDNKDSVINGVASLVNTNTNETEKYALAYVVDDDDVLYIYVVDVNYFTVTWDWYNDAAEADWTDTKVELSQSTFNVWANQPKTVTVTLTKTNGNFGAGYTFPVYVDGVQYGDPVDTNATNTIIFTVEVSETCEIQIGEGTW